MVLFRNRFSRLLAWASLVIGIFGYGEGPVYFWASLGRLLLRLRIYFFQKYFFFFQNSFSIVFLDAGFFFVYLGNFQK